MIVGVSDTYNNFFKFQNIADEAWSHFEIKKCFSQNDSHVLKVLKDY